MGVMIAAIASLRSSRWGISGEGRRIPLKKECFSRAGGLEIPCSTCVRIELNSQHTHSGVTNTRRE